MKKAVLSTVLATIAILGTWGIIVTQRDDTPPQDLKPLPQSASVAVVEEPPPPPPEPTGPPRELPEPLALAALEQEEHRCEVRGLVLALDGSPVENATVTYAWRPNNREVAAAGTADYGLAINPPTVETGPDGRFQFTALPRGNVAVTARKDQAHAATSQTLDRHRLALDLILVLHPGQPIGGVVVNERGEGVADAQVLPLRNDGEEQSSWWPDTHGVHTDAAGAFLIPGLAPETWEFYVVAEEYANQFTEPVSVGTLNARFVLSPGVPLRGVVVDEVTNAPLAGVPVTAGLKDTRLEPHRATSDAQGRFELAHLAAETYVVDIDNPPFTLQGGPATVAIAGNRIPDPLHLLVVTGGTVRGRLIVEDTDEGVPGVTMVARLKSNQLHARHPSPTSQDGSFEIVGLSAGTHIVRHADWRVHGYARGRRESRREVTVAPGGVVEDVILKLPQSASLAGTVRDVAGNPVAFARVLGVVDHMHGGRSDSTLTDEIGRFFLAGLDVGRPYMLAARANTARSRQQGPFEAGSLEAQDIELILDIQGDAVIAGQAKYENGQPFLGRVIGVPRGESLSHTLSWSYDRHPHANGNFVLTGLAAATYDLVLSPTNEGEGRQIAGTVHVPPGAVVRGVRLVYTGAERLDITGWVVDADGNHVAGALVNATWREDINHYSASRAVTRRDGSFTLRSLAQGAYELEVTQEGYNVIFGVSVQAGDTDVEITLRRQAARIEGEVVDAHTGTAVTAFEIAAIYSEWTDWDSHFRAVADPNGRFSIEVANRQAWILLVRAKGYEDFELPLDWTSGTDVQDGGVLTLTPSR